MQLHVTQKETYIVLPSGVIHGQIGNHYQKILFCLVEIQPLSQLAIHL